MPKTPNNHIKPTKEELEAQTKAALEEAEKLAEASEEETEEETPPEEEETEETEEETPQDEEVKEEESKPETDYKKKFTEEARQNQKIYAKNRVINKALADAEDVPEPTEEDLVKEYPDWEMMSDIEKTLAKETVVSRNWRKVISEAKEQASKIEKWTESVEEFADDPKTLVENPELEGKTDEFKVFATQEANNSVPFKILVSAFLHDHSTGQKTNKGRMFEKGLGGSNEKPTPKDGTITIEEARKLRETDYTKYKEMLMAGKIKIDV